MSRVAVIVFGFDLQDTRRLLPSSFYIKLIDSVVEFHI
jgi:hypothetical protein